MENLLQDRSSSKKKIARININFSKTKFSIEDTCGGISVDDAKDRVFLFGDPVRDPSHTGLGVYGIGMKRAFFKIGRDITVTSKTKTTEFRIEINVDRWLADKDNWNFRLAEPPKRRTANSGGVTIEIKRLHKVPASQFDLLPFKKNLMAKIAVAHALFLKWGLEVYVDDEPVDPSLPEIAASKGLTPVRHLSRKDGVDTLILAGLSPKEDRVPRGWYVFCNGRMVLEADKTTTTGWGVSNHASFASKYNHFLGYVYFRSKDVRKLPWKTTKDDVDQENAVYKAAVADMQVYSRPVLQFLSSMYPDVSEPSGPERDLFRTAKAVDPQKLATSENRAFEAKVKTRAESGSVSIQYRRPKKKLESIREFLRRPTMAASQIGEYTFDWFFDRNCE